MYFLFSTFVWYIEIIRFKLKLLDIAKLFGHKLEPKDFTGNAPLTRELVVSSMSDETRGAK